MEIKPFLKKYNIKAQDFASALGITPQYLSRIIKKKQKPGRDLIVKIIDLTSAEVTFKDLGM
jgi:transcriptional regulator with XRE-family HTH domain